MKKIILSFIAVLFSLSASHTLNEYLYLKIEFNQQKTISYPPGISFLAKDSQGNEVLSLNALKKVKTYAITEPITLYVYTFWNDEPNIFQLKSGKLSLGITNRTYAKSVKNHTNRTSKVVEKKNYQIHSNNVYLVGKEYTNFTEENGYDVRLEFSNDVVFEYKNGKVKASQNGRSLVIEDKYIVSLEKGKLKISYHPKTKKVWWVFEKN